MTDDAPPTPAPASIFPATGDGAAPPPTPLKDLSFDELLARVERNDPEAWEALVLRMLKEAWDLVETAAQGDLRDAGPEVKNFLNAFKRDRYDRLENMRGAIWSAAFEMRKKLHDSKKPLEVTSFADCAGHLIRIAYNRWQSRKRSNDRLAGHAGVGSTVPPNGGPALIEAVADPSKGPAELAEDADYVRYLHDEGRLLARELDGEFGAEIFYLSFEKRLTLEQIHAELQRTYAERTPSVARIHRRVAAVVDHLRRRYAASHGDPAGPPE
jgi:hypothetical protein